MGPTELQLSLACLEKIRQTGSILDKKDLLKKFDSKTLRLILQLAYDDRKFGFGSEAKVDYYSCPLGSPYDISMWWEEVVSLLSQNTMLSPVQKAIVDNLASHSPDGHYLQLLVGILTKDLRLGMRSTTILQVFPNLFEVFHVQLAKPFNLSRVVFPCAVEPKFDGIRAVYINGRYLSRYGQELRGPEISCPGAFILDGELVAGHFQDTLSAVRVGGDLRYYVFDCISQEEWSSKVFKMTYMDRLNALSYTPLRAGIPRKWCNSMEQIESFHAENLAHGLEGSMVKANVPYELKRSYSWMKIKPTLDMDVQVTGLVEGEGKYEGALGALICVTPAGQEFNLGTGISDAQREEWWDEATKLHGLFLELTYQELTIDGIPRFARFKRWRPDKEQP